MNTDPRKPQLVKKLDHAETNRLREEITDKFTDIIVSQPKSAEAASASLAALIFCAYSLAKALWGVSDAVRAVKAAVDIEAGRDNKEKN